MAMSCWRSQTLFTSFYPSPIRSRSGLKIFRRHVNLSRVLHGLFRTPIYGRVSDWLSVCFLLSLTHSLLHIGPLSLGPLSSWIPSHSIPFYFSRTDQYTLTHRPLLSHARTFLLFFYFYPITTLRLIATHDESRSTFIVCFCLACLSIYSRVPTSVLGKLDIHWISFPLVSLAVTRSSEGSL